MPVKHIGNRRQHPSQNHRVTVGDCGLAVKVTDPGGAGGMQRRGIADLGQNGARIQHATSFRQPYNERLQDV